MKEVSVQELKSMIDSKEDFQLIDVREQNEYDFCHINGELVPLKTIESYADKIRKDVKVVIYCRSGARSGNAVAFLENEFGFENLYNLKGGILAYSREIDSSIPLY